MGRVWNILHRVFTSERDDVLRRLLAKGGSVSAYNISMNRARYVHYSVTVWEDDRVSLSRKCESKNVVTLEIYGHLS